MRDPTDRMGARERQSEENEKDISLQSGASPAEVERSLARFRDAVGGPAETLSLSLSLSLPLIVVHI